MAALQVIGRSPYPGFRECSVVLHEVNISEFRGLKRYREEEDDTEDTGFFSQTETETEDDSRFDEILSPIEGESWVGWKIEERHEWFRLRAFVSIQYPAVLAKYLNSHPPSDPFNGIHFWELCVLLEQSSNRSGLIVASQLLDLAIQVFALQVWVCDKNLKKLAEDLSRLHRLQKKTTGRTLAENASNHGISAPEDEHHSQKSNVGRQQGKKFLMSKNNSKISDNAELTYDFLKERCANVFARRKCLFGRFNHMVRSPFLDYEFEPLEYYLEESDKESSRRPNLSVTYSSVQLLKNMTLFTKAKEMSSLPEGLPSLSYHTEDSHNDNEMDETEIVEPINVDSSMNELCEDISNAENSEPSLQIPQQDAQNNTQEEENHPARRRPAKRKSSRIPLLNRSNNIIEEGILPEKRSRDSNDAAISDQEILREVNSEDLENSTSNNLFDRSAPIDEEPTLPDFLGSPPNTEFFIPPDPLFNPEPETLNFQMRTTLVDMKAVKTQFNDIVCAAYEAEKEITFVDIINKSGMDILLSRSDKLEASTSGLSTSSSESSYRGEISVGVAFLALLHNASCKRYFLVEEDEGNFKVTKEKPPDVRSIL